MPGQNIVYVCTRKRQAKRQMKKKKKFLYITLNRILIGRLMTIELKNTNISVHVHVHCRDFNIFSSHSLLSSDLVAQSVEQRGSNPKVVGSIPTLVRVFLCPCVGPFPLVGLTLTWFIWGTKLALLSTL